MPAREPLEAEILHDEGQPQAPATESSAPLARPADLLPNTLYLLPLVDRPFFPAQGMPVVMDEQPWLETVQRIGDEEQPLTALVLTRVALHPVLAAHDFYLVGTAARMHNPNRGEGQIQFVAEGLERIRIVRWLSAEPPFRVQVEYLRAGQEADPEELRAHALAIFNSLRELIPLNPLFGEELKHYLGRFNPNDPSPLADFAAGITSHDKHALQEILETLPLVERMQKVLVLLRKELEVARLQAKIREQVEEKMSEQQRKFFLREQLKAIQQELGLEKDDRTADVERFTARLEGLTLTDNAKKRIDDELQKLAILEAGSPEYTVTRNYLDWITALPWGRFVADNLDLTHARQVLDTEHDGLDEVKKRILEFLAVGAMRGAVAGSIILLVGPPGVGKTSIGHSIAEALGRPFYRFSLGGMRDEAEIKGHRRTYIGAMPGKFIQAIKECGAQNPVIMLDEIDKIGASYQGDPASALLEVLDPAQNVEFLDHYIDCRFDLSKVLFVCTANQLDSIPGPLLDRMEVIPLSSYIAEEKLAIAKHHLWPRQLERAGMRPAQVKLSDAALRQLIEGYAREAGVRSLEKLLARIIRKAALRLLEGEKGPIRIAGPQLVEYLGQPRFKDDKPLSGVGVVTGLAWTALGGAVLSVEATEVHQKGRGFKLTGKLGEVMRESAEIAYSFVTAHLQALGADPECFAESLIHLHVPEGATPKDGPSAGVTMASALLSLALGKKVRNLAMTGELTLTGQVLPVGGIREKVIAARRVGIRELILPKANRIDYEELPAHIRAQMQVHFAAHYQDIATLLYN